MSAEEILITIFRASDVISFEFPGECEIALPKSALMALSQYFRTMCENDTEAQYIIIDTFNLKQCAALRHFLLIMSNGFNNALDLLPFNDRIKLLEFDELLMLEKSVMYSLASSLIPMRYEMIKSEYGRYWNYRFIKFEDMAQVALREQRISVVFDWLNEKSWTNMNMCNSTEFSKCQHLIQQNPKLIPADLLELKQAISGYSHAYLIIDVKKFINALTGVFNHNNYS